MVARLPRPRSVSIHLSATPSFSSPRGMPEDKCCHRLLAAAGRRWRGRWCRCDRRHADSIRSGAGQIIIRGAKRDVERVMEVIKEIELKSELTRPDIEVVRLQYTDANAVARC